MRTSITGKIGEDLACGYLVNNGYQIIDRNYRKKIGEIDIIAKSPDKTLVFVEVKTITVQNPPVDKSPASYPLLAGFKTYIPPENNDSFKPEDHMNSSKMTKFRRMCEWYVNNNPELTGKKGFRLDVLAIEMGNGRVSIRHYKNV